MKNFKKIIPIIIVIVLVAFLIIGIIVYKNINKKPNDGGSTSSNIKKYACVLIEVDKPVFTTKYQNGIDMMVERPEFGNYDLAQTVDMTFDNDNLIYYNRTITYDFSEEEGFERVNPWVEDNSVVYNDKGNLMKYVSDNLEVIKYGEITGNNRIEEYLKKYEAGKFVCSEVNDDYEYTCKKIVIDNNDYKVEQHRIIESNKEDVVSIKVFRQYHFYEEDAYNNMISTLSGCNDDYAKSENVTCGSYLNIEKFKNALGNNIDSYIKILEQDNYECTLTNKLEDE